MESAIEAADFSEDQDVKDFIAEKGLALKQARADIEKKFELDSEQKKVLKQIAGKKVDDVKVKIGESGEKMGFDEFKVIETTMTKLEERLLPELRSQQRKARMELLKED